jgi:hypothetical protein
MGLAEFQQVLATLYTDEAFRRQFFEDETLNAESLGLNAGDLDLLKRLNPGEVAYFSQSLVNKHYSEAGPWVPWVCLALGNKAKKLFQRYLGQRDPSKSLNPRQHAKAFIEYLQERSVLQEVPAPCFYDLLKYERCRLMEYPLKDILHVLHQGGDLWLVGARACWVAWLKLPGMQRPLQLILTWPSFKR